MNKSPTDIKIRQSKRSGDPGAAGNEPNLNNRHTQGVYTPFVWRDIRNTKKTRKTVQILPQTFTNFAQLYPQKYTTKRALLPTFPQNSPKIHTLFPNFYPKQTQLYVQRTDKTRKRCKFYPKQSSFFSHFCNYLPGF